MIIDDLLSLVILIGLFEFIHMKSIWISLFASKASNNMVFLVITWLLISFLLTVGETQ